MQPFLRNLAFEQQAPHGRPRRVRGQIRGRAIVGFMPALIIFSWVPGEQDTWSVFADQAHQILHDGLAVFEFQQPVVVTEIDVVLARNAY